MVTVRQWHVLGAGAIGCLMAQRLHRANIPVSLLLRDRGNENALAVTVDTDRGSDTVILPVSDRRDTAAIDYLLVTTKAFDVMPAIDAIASRLHRNSTVLLLVNGMGLIEALQPVLPCRGLYAGVTTEGAYRVAPHHVRHAGHGRTDIGQAGQSVAPDWFERFAAALGNGHWHKDINAALWQKLAINSAINPLTAIHRCPNGELACNADLAAEVDQLCDEIIAISVAAGYGHAVFNLRTEVAQVIAATASNRSSMLQDLSAGRSTEIEYITGYLLAAADRFGISAPRNRKLLSTVKKLEH